MTTPDPQPVVDPATQPVPDPNAPEAEEIEEEVDGLDPKAAAKINKANREAKALRDRVKALEAIETEYNKSRDAEKSELTKAQEALAKKDKELGDLVVSNYRRDAALAAGLTQDDVEFITGSTAEECDEQAKKLAKRVAAVAEAQKPKTNLLQGQRGTPPAGAVEDNNALLRRMAGFQS